MFDACVFIFIDGHIIKRPAGTYVVACVCSNLSSGSTSSIPPIDGAVRPAVRGRARARRLAPRRRRAAERATSARAAGGPPVRGAAGG